MPKRPPVHKPHAQRSEKQRRAEIDARRGSSSARGYDAVWRKLRKVYLIKNPLCVFCEEEGKLTPATVVDHIVPIAQAPVLRLDPKNLRSLCKPHHDARTAKEQGFARGF